MKKTSEPIVFFGSGPVAAASLRFLAQHYTIERVITKPRPPHHRGDVPVVELASKLGLPTTAANTRQQLDDIFDDYRPASRVGIIVDFGVIVSQKIINAFPLGILNSHFSLLPQWRGADPITFAILSGQQRTGVSIMQLAAALDTGPLLAQASIDIGPTTTTPQLTDELVSLSNTLLLKTLPAYLEGTLQPTAQDTNTMQPTYSRRLTKADGLIDWHKPAAQIEREIRAYQGWPKSTTKLGSVDVIVLQAHVADQTNPVGALHLDGKILLVGCSEQSLAIDKLQPIGKAAMDVAAFIAGYKAKLEA